MPLITQAIPNLVQGVSQQPPAQRLAGQSEVQINAYSDPVTGLRKRPPVTFGKTLRTDKLDLTDDKVSIIKNDSVGKFGMMIHDSKLHVYNLNTGVEAEIENESGTGYTAGLPISSGDYLDTTDSNEDSIFTLSVGDTTYVGNKEVPVSSDNVITDSFDEAAYVYVKQGAVNNGYSIIIDHNDVIGGTDNAQKATVTFSWEARRSGKRTYWYLKDGGVATVNDGGTGYTTDQEIKINFSSTRYRGSVSTADGSLEVTVGANGAITSVKSNSTSFGFLRTNSTSPAHTISEPNDPTFGTGGPLVARYVSKDASKLIIDNDSSDETYDEDVSASSSDLIAERLKEAFLSNTNNSAAFKREGETATSNTRFFVSRKGSMIRIRPKSSIASDFTFSIKTEDGLANNGLQAIYKEVSSITDLPLQAYNNTKVKISGDEASEDDYYVKFETTNGADFGDGYWLETIGFDEILQLDNETLPHVLQQIGEAETSSDADLFKFAPMKVEPKLVGDKLSNPFPSFLTKVIENMFFFKNRLGFLAEDRVVLTEYGLGKQIDDQIYYNFGRTTVQTFVDTDPIDVTVATDKSTTLRSASIFQDKLVLFSDHTQFVLSGERQLTPSTVSIVPVTNYDITSNIHPIAVGDAVYFATNQETSMTVREFILNEVTDTYTAFDITAQVPNYIPTDATYLSGSGSSNIIAVGSRDNRKHLYIYKFLVVDSKKVLSSWSLFTFKHDVAAISFEKDRLDIIFTHNGGTYNGVMDFDPTSKPSNHPFVPLLDCVIEKDYNTTSGSVTLPFTASDLTKDDFDVVSIDGSGEVTQLHTANTKIKVESLSNTAISASSNDGNPAKCYIGMKYDMEYEFSEVIMKVESSHGDTPTNVPYKIRNLSLYYTNVKGTEDKDDGHNIFDLKVTAPRIGDFSSDTKNYGFDTTLDPSDGFFKVPIYLDGNDVKLKLEHKSGYPVNFQNAEIEAITYARAKRY